MAMTKRELIQFMDELVELASEENKTRAILVKEKFISDFEKSYEYEREVQTEVSYLPPYYIAAMPDDVQEEIKQKVIAALTEHGECTPENIENAMCSKIYDLEDLIDIAIIGAVGVIILAKNVMEFAQAYQQQDSSTMNSALKGIVAGVMMAGISTVLTFLGF